MNTDEIRHFLAVYDCGSVTRAAKELFISPQGLSQSIKRLESKIGLRLFLRTAQGMVPTEYARDLSSMFRAISSTEAEIFEYLAEIKRADRTRYLLGRDSMLGDVISTGVKMYNREHRDCQVEPIMMRESEDQLAKVFMEGGYDYRFLSAETNPLPELAQELLFEMSFVPLVNRRALAGWGTFDLGALSSMTVLTEYANATWMKVLEQACQKVGVRLKVREVDKDYLVRLLASSTEVVTFIRSIDLNMLPWCSEEFCPLLENPLNSRIVLQSTRDEIDAELIDCIRASVADSVYGQGLSTAITR